MINLRDHLDKAVEKHAEALKPVIMLTEQDKEKKKEEKK